MVRVDFLALTVASSISAPSRPRAFAPRHCHVLLTSVIRRGEVGRRVERHLEAARSFRDFHRSIGPALIEPRISAPRYSPSCQSPQRTMAFVARMRLSLLPTRALSVIEPPSIRFHPKPLCDLLSRIQRQRRVVLECLERGLGLENSTISIDQ